MEPASDILYPVVNRVDRVRVASAEDYNPDDNQIVTMLASTIYWRSLIRNMLPQGSNGTDLVLSNPCTKSFTYQINGPNAIYLGVGDVQTKYNGNVIHRTLGHQQSRSQANAAHTGAPLDIEFCALTLNVYPSDEMKAFFTTSNPIIFSVALLFIFGFVSLVLYMYDAKVEWQQEAVIHTAVR
jgi:hypothetical protein